MRFIFLLAMTSACFMSGSLLAQSPAATELLSQSILRQNQVGSDDVFREISTRPSDYQTRDLFLYVIDSKGIVMAHSIRHTMIGQNVLDQVSAPAQSILSRILSSRITNQQLELSYLTNSQQTIHLSVRRLGNFFYIVQTKL